MPVAAEDVNRTRRAYLAARQQRAQNVCGALPGGLETWQYHPERCSRRRTGRGDPLRGRPRVHHPPGKEVVMRRQLEALRGRIPALEQTVRTQIKDAAKGTEPNRNLSGDDALIVADLYYMLSVAAPMVVAQVSLRMLEYALIQQHPDVDSRYEYLVQRTEEGEHFVRHFPTKLGVYMLAASRAEEILHDHHV